jgi:hypothetical protein
MLMLKRLHLTKRKRKDLKVRCRHAVDRKDGKREGRRLINYSKQNSVAKRAPQSAFSLGRSSQPMKTVRSLRWAVLAESKENSQRVGMTYHYF